MLKLKGVVTKYGRITALHEVTVQVSAGEVVALVGANGAGKTTLLNTISGLIPCSAGTIHFDGQEIQNVAPDKIVRIGLVHVPENRHLFAPLTVADNLILGAYASTRRNKKAQMRDDLEHIYGIFPILKERAHQRAGTLSGGEQQMLAIGRGLMSHPRLLLLDEPSMGLAPLVMEDIFLAIGRFHQMGITVLIVEQNARWALRIADRGYVMESGRIVMESSAKALLDNEEVQRAYLGKGYRR